MSSSRSKKRDMFTEINITPLTDIFLVLLIIMMVIAPMLDSKGLKLAVPTIGGSKSVTEDPKAMTLTISKEGQFQLEGKTLSAEALQGALYRGKTQFPEGLIIQAEPETLYGSTVTAMDAARAAGIEKIAVSQQ